ncbi:hypothetical protein AAD018_015150 [Aestuariibius insulae]|uniref:hypothetical protein n=1 Tax=Aestuariibius insulae TaxID=2058287 RepID=UPI00345EC07A
MPKFTLNGLELTSNTGGAVRELTNATLMIEPRDAAGNFSLRYVEGQSQQAQVTAAPCLMVYTANGPNNGLLPKDMEMFNLSWEDGIATILAVTFQDEDVEADGIFSIAGDPLPSFENAEALDLFLSEATLAVRPGSGEFEIDLAGAPGVEVTPTVIEDEEEDFVFLASWTDEPDENAVLELELQHADSDVEEILEASDDAVLDTIPIDIGFDPSDDGLL